jgi:hypothetical protein
MHNKEGDQYRLKTFLSHNYFFTFGLNIHKPGCHIPDLNLKWHTTKKPICTDKWFKKNENHQQSFTSILNWIERPPFQYNNQWWGQKNIIFKKFQSLPQFFPQLNFGLIVNTDQNDKAKADMAELKQIGWKILDPNNVIKDMNEYRDFIQDSAAEFSITKETYIKSNSGWFSGRSACYLAAGRPVVTQDTMWSKYIPEGEGLFACNDLAEAKESISKISAEYQKHSKKAREIAIEYFDSKTILEDLLSKVQSTSATL